MEPVRRRTVVAGVVGTLPLLSGCSDPGTTIRLAPADVRAVSAAGDDRTWDVSFTLAYDLHGLDEEDGLYGVSARLIASDGTSLERIEHGDLAWRALPAERRETDEAEDEVEIYRGTLRERVSTTTARFPRWIAFTADRALGSGVWTDVSVRGATADPFGSAAGTDRTRGGANDSRNGTGPTGNRSVENVTTDGDRGRLEVAGDDWESVRLNRYREYPPSDEIPTVTNDTDGTADETVTRDGRDGRIRDRPDPAP